MSRGVNKVILICTLGKDPEAKSFANGGSVTNVTAATNEEWKDKDGNKQSRTEWHNVVFHNKLGEIVAQYCRKGAKIYVEGSIRTRKYQDKTSGQDRYITEIHANEMQMLDGKGDATPRTEQRQDRQGNRTAPAAHDDGGFEDDSIPF